MAKAQKEKMPKKKKVIIIVSVLLTLVILLSLLYVFGIGGFLCSMALDRDFKMALDVGSDDLGETYSQADGWWTQFSDNEATITSDDGLKLTAYEFRQENPSEKWAIAIHGYRGNARQMAIFAKYYYDQGFNVLAPDLRAHGKSEGKYIGMGWLDRLDVLKWIDKIIGYDSNAEILLHGVSMGAATVMMTTGEALPENVKAAVADCGYTSVYEQFAYVSEEYLGISSALTMPQGNLMIKLIAGYDTKEASSVEQLKKSQTPTVFIHGTADSFVPFFMLKHNFKACAAPKASVEIDGAEHAASIAVDPDTYWSEIFKFVKEKMLFSNLL